MFTNPQFITSATKPEQFPKEKPFPEIAVIGRSNVGKSSLINHLTQNKKIAKVSNTAGKTQAINFFQTNQNMMLVDLPGYGFAKVSKTMREEWGHLIESYLLKRQSLALLLLLCDLRHLPTSDDIDLAKWALFFKKPLLLVFTKADKLTNTQAIIRLKENSAHFSTTLQVEFPILPYSIKDGKSRNALTKEIEKRITWD